MRKIPIGVENIILDYYWSHKLFLLKQRVHCELLLAFTLMEIRMWFYRAEFIQLSPF